MTNDIFLSLVRLFYAFLRALDLGEGHLSDTSEYLNLRCRRFFFGPVSTSLVIVSVSRTSYGINSYMSSEGLKYETNRFPASKSRGYPMFLRWATTDDNFITGLSSVGTSLINSLSSVLGKVATTSIIKMINLVVIGAG